MIIILKKDNFFLQNSDNSDDSGNETPSSPEKGNPPRPATLKPERDHSEKENSYQQTFSQVEKERLNRLDKFQKSIKKDDEKLNNSKRKRSLSFSSSVENKKKEHLSNEKISSVKVGKKHKSKKSKDLFETKNYKNKKGRLFYACFEMHEFIILCFFLY